MPSILKPSFSGIARLRTFSTAQRSKLLKTIAYQINAGSRDESSPLDFLIEPIPDLGDKIALIDVFESDKPYQPAVVEKTARQSVACLVTLDLAAKVLDCFLDCIDLFEPGTPL